MFKNRFNGKNYKSVSDISWPKAMLKALSEPQKEAVSTFQLSLNTKRVMAGPKLERDKPVPVITVGEKWWDDSPTWKKEFVLAHEGAHAVLGHKSKRQKFLTIWRFLLPIFFAMMLLRDISPWISFVLIEVMALGFWVSWKRLQKYQEREAENLRKKWGIGENYDPV